MTPSLRRRSLFGIAGLGAVALTAAACTSDESADASGASDAGSGSGSGSDGSALLPAAEGTTQYPLTLTTPWGETVLEERPTRIATIDGMMNTLQIVVALGGVPVAAPEFADFCPWITEALDGEVETVFTTEQDSAFPVETIAAAKPDLIIALNSEGIGDFYTQLASICPVLAAPSEEEQQQTWEEQLPLIAEALDLQAAGEAAQAAHHEKIAAIAEEHPEFAGSTVSFSLFYGDGDLVYFSSAGSDAEALFLGLGFSANPLAEQFVDDSVVSSELLSQLDADVILLADNSDGAIQEKVIDQPLFQELTAVKEDRLILIENNSTSFTIDGTETAGNLPWGLARPGILSTPWVGEQLAPVLASTLA
ncbi:ABC transporter substrate-binding protein [Brachybacterium sp. DNPG3]